MAFRLHWECREDVFWLVETNDSVLEMSEEILLSDSELTSAFLLGIFKVGDDEGTDDCVVVVCIDVFQIEYLSIAKICQIIASD